MRFLRAAGLSCLVLVGVIGIILLLMAVFPKAILRAPSLDVLHPIIVIFFRPRDYYATILSLPARDAMKVPTGAEGSLKHMYPGKYAIEVMLARPVNSMTDLPDYSLSIFSIEGQKASWKFEASKQSSQLEYTRDGRAILVGIYTVPDDLPLDEGVNIKCLLQVEGDCPAIVLGTIRVSKISDL